MKEISVTSKQEKLVSVQLNDVSMLAEPDSRAEVNIMDEYQYKAFVHRTKDPPVLRTSRLKLYNLQDKLAVKGEFDTIIRNKTCGIPTQVIVIKGHMKSPPLLSRSTLIQLGMMKIDPDGKLACSHEMKITDDAMQVKSTMVNDSVSAIVDKYKNVFEGIGLILDKKKDQPIYGRFRMKESIEPVTSTQDQYHITLRNP